MGKLKISVNVFFVKKELLNKKLYLFVDKKNILKKYFFLS